MKTTRQRGSGPVISVVCVAGVRTGGIAVENSSAYVLAMEVAAV